MVFQLDGSSVFNLPPLVILIYSFLSKLSLALVKPLTPLCSCVTTNLLIVKQYFIFGPKKRAY